MALFQFPAIVLRTHPFEETHLIATLFSPTRGKIRTIAKGCRRLQSALGRAVSPMVFSQFQAAEGKNLDLITQAVVKCGFPEIRGRLDRLAHGLYALELVDKLVEEPEPHPKLFFLLLKTLEALEAGENPAGLLRVFEAHLLRFLGYAPELARCVRCASDACPAAFSFSLGGVVCQECQTFEPRAVACEPGVFAAMRRALQANPATAVAATEGELRTAASLFQKFIEEKSGRTLHGLELLRQIDSPARP